MKALLIKNAEMSPAEIRMEGSGSNHVHEIVGDYLCSCFVVPIRGTVGFGRSLVGYCDDNFINKDLPLNVILSPELYAAEPNYAIHGPIVVLAHRGPDTTSMTDDERSRFYTVDSPRGPVLKYRRK